MSHFAAIRCSHNRSQMAADKMEEEDRLEKLVPNIVDKNIDQSQVLEKLEQKWLEITTNLNQVITHLRESSNQVMGASVQCLESLVDSVESSCDKIDNELKAQYHLMTKCDELITKLSIAASFRDEVKTLRKSVETLELLYK